MIKKNSFSYQSITFFLLGALLLSSSGDVQAQPNSQNKKQWVLEQLNQYSSRFGVWGRKKIAGGMRRFTKPSKDELGAIQKWVKGDALSSQEKRLWRVFKNRALSTPQAIAAIGSIILLVIIAIGGGSLLLYSRKKKRDEALPKQKKQEEEQQEKKQQEKEKEEERPEQGKEQQEKKQQEKEKEEERPEQGKERLDKDQQEKEEEEKRKQEEQEKQREEERLQKEKQKKAVKKQEKEELKKLKAKLKKLAEVMTQEQVKKAYSIARFLESANYGVMAENILNYLSKLNKQQNIAFNEFLSPKAREHRNQLIMRFQLQQKYVEDYERAQQLEQQAIMQKEQDRRIDEEIEEEWEIIPANVFEQWRQLHKKIIQYINEIEANIGKNRITRFEHIEDFKEVDPGGLQKGEKVKMAEDIAKLVGQGTQQGKLQGIMNFVFKQGLPPTYEEIESWVKNNLAKIKGIKIEPKKVYDFLGGNQPDMKPLIQKKIQELKNTYTQEELNWLSRQLEYFFNDTGHRQFYDAYVKGSDAVAKLPTLNVSEENKMEQVDDIAGLKEALSILQKKLK